MKRSLKRIALGFLALMFPCLGWAATATATWTDFNTLTSGGFTLTKADACTVNEDGSLTLGGAGLQYTFVSGDGMYDNKNVSIVMDVTFPETIEGTMHLVNVKHTAENAAIGVATTSDTLQTLWNLSTGSRVAKTWSPTGRKTITVTYAGGGNGVDVYVDGALVATDTSLKTGGSNLGVLTIGAYHDGSQSATGMIVHSLKVYASKLSTFDAEQQGFIDSMAWRASFNGANTTEGWITGWGGEADNSYVDTITGQGYQIKSGCHPWVNYTVNKPFSIALYANVSEIANTNGKKAVLIALGNSGSNFVLAKTDENTIAVCQGNTIVGDLHITDADIAVPGSYL